MSTTNSPVFWYNKASNHFSLPGLISDDIRIALCTSAYVPDAVNHEFFDVSVTNELPTANGYTAGGIALITKALTFVSAGVYKFVSDNPSWTASGTGLTHRLWVLYNNTPVSSKPLLCYGFSDYNGGTPLDVVTASGFPLSLIVPALGYFTATQVNGA